MLHLHEVLPNIHDYLGRGELEAGLGLAEEHMDALDSAELRFIHLTLLAKMGRDDGLAERLEIYLETERWFSPWFMQRDSALRRLEETPRGRSILQAAAEKVAAYRQSGAAAPVVQAPPSGHGPYPLLVALHGNGFSPQHSAIHWAFAADSGWLVFHPLAPHLVTPGHFWWDAHEESRAAVDRQYGEWLCTYAVDAGRVLLGGFSKGGEVAMVLALGGWMGARGFVTVGAGGYYHMQPALWQPLLASPPPGLRGVALYSPYDLGRSGVEDRTLPMLAEAGVEVRLEIYPGEGHVFPDDFPERFGRAVEFIMTRPNEQPLI